MFTPLPAGETAVLASGSALLAIASLRFLLLPWWKIKWLRAFWLAAACAPLVGLLMWQGGPAVGSARAAYYGVVLTWGGLVLLGPAILTLPAAGGLLALLRRRLLPPRRTPGPAPHAITRRALVQLGAAALPMASLSASVAGFTQSSAPQRMPIVRMTYRDLHPALDGLRILHLSDLHLGADMHVADLEAVLVRARALAPHLTLVTGDVADNLEELEAGLALLGKYAPSLGVYASLGNHEYLHGIGRTRPLYEKSPVSLLVNRGTVLHVGGAKLYLGGANDPVSCAPDISGFMDATVEQAMAGAPKEAFRLLLSHRPDGFVAAAKRGVDLTLSGHTHGMQVGFQGRSAFESIYPERFLWGDYRRGTSRLYTTSGFGHWFPFRFNCPTEAPLIVLASEPNGREEGRSSATAARDMRARLPP